MCTTEVLQQQLYIVSKGFVGNQQKNSKETIRYCIPCLHCIKSCTGSTWVRGYLSPSLCLSFQVKSPLPSPLCPLNSKMNRGNISQERGEESISDRTHLLLSYSPEREEGTEKHRA